VIFAVGVVAKTGMLESVFSFGGVDVDLRRSIEADGSSFNDLGIGRQAGEDLIGEMGLERSQFTSF